MPSSTDLVFPDCFELTAEDQRSLLNNCYDWLNQYLSASKSYISVLIEQSHIAHLRESINPAFFQANGKGKATSYAINHYFAGVSFWNNSSRDYNPQNLLNNLLKITGFQDDEASFFLQLYCFRLLKIMIDRGAKGERGLKLPALNYFTCKNLLIGIFLCAYKINIDNPISNRQIAENLQLEINTLNSFELDVAHLLNWKLTFPPSKNYEEISALCKIKSPNWASALHDPTPDNLMNFFITSPLTFSSSKPLLEPPAPPPSPRWKSQESAWNNLSNVECSALVLKCFNWLDHYIEHSQSKLIIEPLELISSLLQNSPDAPSNYFWSLGGITYTPSRFVNYLSQHYINEDNVSRAQLQLFATLHELLTNPKQRLPLQALNHFTIQRLIMALFYSVMKDYPSFIKQHITLSDFCQSLKINLVEMKQLIEQVELLTMGYPIKYAPQQTINMLCSLSFPAWLPVLNTANYEYLNSSRDSDKNSLPTELIIDFIAFFSSGPMPSLADQQTFFGRTPFNQLDANNPRPPEMDELKRFVPPF